MKKEFEDGTPIYGIYTCKKVKTEDDAKEIRQNINDSYNVNVCPSCGFSLQYRRGKMECFNCGYFESCCGG